MLGRVQVPAQVKKGEPFEIRVLVQHAMETGFRRDMDVHAHTEFRRLAALLREKRVSA